jgi:hypothetical protein
MVVETHPERPYCWWWKNTMHIHTAGGVETPCTSILLVVERQPTTPSMVQPAAKMAGGSATLTQPDAGQTGTKGNIPGTSAGQKDRFKLPSMIPKPTASSGSKKKIEEPDIIPTETYRKIRENLKKANILPTIGGSGSGSVANESVGSFYNKGDNRMARSLIKEDANALFTTSKSFNSENWDCYACPVKHSVLGGGVGGGGGILQAGPYNYGPKFSSHPPLCHW